MAWYFMAKEMSCEQVPMMEILHEFRSLAGIKGRYAHRGHPPTTGPTQYAPTRVKIEIDAADE